MVVVGVSDEAYTAKCFNPLNGEIVDTFHRVKGNCFSLDVSQDSTSVCFGDSKGGLHFENINYEL